MDTTAAERKVALTEEFLSVYNQVDGGFTKWKAVMVYDVVKVKLALLDRHYNTGKIDKKMFLERLERNIQDLEYVVKCIGEEPEGSREGRVVAGARVTLSQAKDVLLFSTFL